MPTPNNSILFTQKEMISGNDAHLAFSSLGSIYL